MAVTTTETVLIAHQMAEFLNRLTKQQADLLGDGMALSAMKHAEFSHQQLMDGFAALIAGDVTASWSWVDPEEDASEAAIRERQHLIDRGQLEMWPENEGRH